MSLAAQFGCLSEHDPDSMTVDQARAFIRRQLSPIELHERVALRDALGRVLAREVIAPYDVPAHNNSAMDGYAVRHADLPVDGEACLRVVGTALAGKAFGGSIGVGECVRIMTGAIPPPGADTVVVQEAVRMAGDTILVPPGQRLGQHIRRAGEDLATGKPALAAGRRIRPAELGLIASLGQAEVTVVRRLRVAFFSTGDELCSIGTPLAAGEVYDSNRYTLFGMLTRMGCEVLDLGVIGDDPAALEAAFRQAAAAADVVLSSGGVSVGEADFVKAMLAQLGEVLFWKIAMKPGRPMAFGRLGTAQGAWLFGLPGNPVAVMVTFYQFVREALYKLMGVDPLPILPLLPAVCTAALKKAPGRTEFLRGVLSQAEDGQYQVRPTGAQGSGVLRSMSDANCFIVLDRERGAVSAGETVHAQMFDGLV